MFKSEIATRLETLNAYQNRVNFKDFAPLTEDDFKNFLQGNCFDSNAFIAYLAEEYADDQRVENALKEYGHEGLINRFDSLKSDLYAWADKNSQPSNDVELVKSCVEYALKLDLESIQELALYVYLEQNPEIAAQFDTISADNFDAYIDAFIRGHHGDNPIIFDLKREDCRQTLTVEEFEALLNRKDWEKHTGLEERDRYETDGHDHSWGYVWNTCTLDDYEIEYVRSYSYDDYMPESFQYGDNADDPNVRTNFDVEDDGHTLTTSEIEDILDGYVFFTSFEDGDFYERLNDIFVVGNGPEAEQVKRDYAPDFEAHYFDKAEFSNQTWDSVDWYVVAVYKLGDEQILISVQTHSRWIDAKSTYQAEVFNRTALDKIREWLEETPLANEDGVIDKMIENVKE